ncbi:hypothetical protein AX23_02915 [Brucella melitensis 548]|nr:hypothetical protein AX23_02915 [Brucella melitensis 548]
MTAAATRTVLKKNDTILCRSVVLRMAGVVTLVSEVCAVMPMT